MECLQVIQLEKRKKADVLVIPFWKEEGGAQVAYSLTNSLSKHFASVLQTKDFKAKEGELLYIYVEGQMEQRFLLVGLGSREKINRDVYRHCYGSVTKSCVAKSIKNLNILLPQVQNSHPDLIKGVIEGLLLANYLYNGLKRSDPEDEKDLVQKITLIGDYDGAVDIVNKSISICKGVYYARDLVNGNADDVTPQHLVQCAKEIAKKYPAITTTVFDKKQIEKEKMGLLLAVNRGSGSDPAFIMMQYRGNSGNDHTVLVGKGVTYDTGGLNLKPTGGIETMKCDMAGAAAGYGLILAVADLELNVNLSVVIPTTENSIDANSFKPGDVYMSFAGKSVEMTNSDAEGRLILADALAYACKKLAPTRIIDIATLTGAIEVALGSEASGLMSSSDELANALCQAGESTHERLWRMPLYEEYHEKLKSDVADLKSWNGRSASSSVAAIFLQDFVDKNIPWAHLDIAGTAYVMEAKKYLPKYATGVGVRLLVEFLENISQPKKPALKSVKKVK
jgi:leucyl aminopeptidase